MDGEVVGVGGDEEGDADDAEEGDEDDDDDEEDEDDEDDEDADDDDDVEGAEEEEGKCFLCGDESTCLHQDQVKLPGIDFR